MPLLLMGAVTSFLLGVRSLFRQHVGEGGLDVDRAATLVAMSRWKLARRLAAYDTEGNWVPYLAESFTPSDDLMSWTMTLPLV